MPIIVIVNRCLMLFGALFLIGWFGGGMTYRHNKYFLNDLFSWMVYIAFPVFALAVLVRFIIFLITGN